MPDFKQVWSFASPGIKGGIWSETWYLSSSSLTNAAFIPTDLMRARLSLLNAKNQITKIRVSQVGNPRATTVVNVKQYGLDAFPNPVAPAPIDSAIVCTISSSVVPATRRWWLRGWDVGDAFRDVNTGNDVFGQALVSGVKDFLTALQKYSYEILVLQKATTAPYGWTKVISVDGTAANGTSVVTFAGNFVPPVPSQVIFGQFSKKDLPGLQGVFTIQSLGVPANSIVIPYSTPGYIKVIPATGRGRQLGYISGAVIDLTISGPSFIGGRKTRSPFTGSRGARSANRRLRLSP